MLALMIGTATAPFTAESEAQTPMFPPNTYLVKARVIRVDEAKNSAADFVIESVYAGDSAWKGQSFTLSDYLARSGSQRGKPLPERVVGEVGLWWIGCEEPSASPGKDKTKLFSYHDLWHKLPSIYRPFPSVLKGGPEPARFLSRQYGDLTTNPYDFGPKRMLEWADAIKRIYETKGDDERITLLKVYAGSDNSPLSAWALDTLSRFLEPEAKSQLFTREGEMIRSSEILIRSHKLEKYVRKDVKSMLEDFADDPKVPIYAQTELDRVLTRIDDDWLKSERRAKMLKRWEKVKDPVDRYFIKVQLKSDASK
jgi:hypothetical protein